MGIHSILQSISSLGFILAAKRSKPSTAFKTSRVFTATKQDHCHVTKSFWYRKSAVFYATSCKCEVFQSANATESCIGNALFGDSESICDFCAQQLCYHLPWSKPHHRPAKWYGGTQESDELRNGTLQIPQHCGVHISNPAYLQWFKYKKNLKQHAKIQLVGGWTTHLKNMSQNGNLPQFSGWFFFLIFETAKQFSNSGGLFNQFFVVGDHCKAPAKRTHCTLQQFHSVGVWAKGEKVRSKMFKIMNSWHLCTLQNIWGVSSNGGNYPKNTSSDDHF